jgi:membrane protein implicated in regulation of membrane protease activity
MGFIKAFGFAEIPQLSQNFSKTGGLLWLTVALAFVSVGLLFLMKNNLWFWIAIGAVLISQTLIITNWQDAKFGTIANLIVFVAAIIAVAGWNFERQYKQDVFQSSKNVSISKAIISEKDIEHLPIPVQKYLKYVGVLGKPKIETVKAIFNGKMREKGKDWFAFTSEQYNFFENPTRLFFMKANFKGLPTQGYHRYKDGQASMLIKLLSLFPVVAIKVPEMFKTETVTFFNDICLFAPAALINKKIEWETIDSSSVKATFTNRGQTISAILYFDNGGRLINFISEDRVDVNSNQSVPFSTPILKYGNLNGYNLPVAADAIWHFPDGNFVYGKFYLQDVQYNSKNPE